MAHRVVDAGVDVSKPWLDVALWPTRETARVNRDATGLHELAGWLTLHERPSEKWGSLSLRGTTCRIRNTGETG